MKATDPVIHSDAEIMGGTPVFVGTRVPLATLLDYLEAGQPLSEFLEDFPTVTKEQAVAALEQAKEALLDRARSASKLGSRIAQRVRGSGLKTDLPEVRGASAIAAEFDL